MKRLICIALVVIAILSVLTGCSKRDGAEVDAILDYYVTRMSFELSEKDIKFVCENSENGQNEYSVVYTDKDGNECEESIFVSVYGKAYTLYNEEGERLHIYNGTNSDTKN